MSDTLTVGQLQRKAKNALAREFRGPVWVSGEVRSIRDHRGNLYITLVEPGDFVDGTDTSLDVAAWARRAAVMKAQLNDAGTTLAAGMQIRVSGNVTLSKVGRLHVELIALDIEALVGNQAAEKRKLYAALAKEDLLDANKRLPAPLVPLRVGLVTSEGSEGCNDFLGQFERSEYRFEVVFRHSPVQGPAAPAALARAIESLHNETVDVIAIVRGGGGELDAFDKEPVARAIATSPVAVWTGVGHTGDHSVADDVAQRALVTPTECGHAIVTAVREFDDRLNATATRLHTLAQRAVESAAGRLESRSVNVARCAMRHVDSAAQRLDTAHTRLRSSAMHTPDHVARQVSEIAAQLKIAIARAEEKPSTQIDYIRRHLNSLDPKRPLQRGFSLTHTEDGHLVEDAKQLAAGDIIVTELARGRVRSKVEK